MHRTMVVNQRVTSLFRKHTPRQMMLDIGLACSTKVLITHNAPEKLILKFPISHNAPYALQTYLFTIIHLNVEHKSTPF